MAVVSKIRIWTTSRSNLKSTLAIIWHKPVIVWLCMTAVGGRINCHMLLNTILPSWLHWIRLCPPGDQQWPVLGSHHRRRIPALWGKSWLCKPVPEIHERCPSPQRPLCGGEDSGACREAENTRQEQVEKKTHAAPPGTCTELWLRTKCYTQLLISIFVLNNLHQ